MSGRDQPQMRVRLTPEMREWIEKQAQANCRSVNRQIEFCVLQAMANSRKAGAEAAGERLEA